MTATCDGCGSPKWVAASPGSLAQTRGPDGWTLLLKPIPAVPTCIWCWDCWPWRIARDAQHKTRSH